MEATLDNATLAYVKSSEYRPSSLPVLRTVPRLASQALREEFKGKGDGIVRLCLFLIALDSLEGKPMGYAKAVQDTAVHSAVLKGVVEKIDDRLIIDVTRIEDGFMEFVGAEWSETGDRGMGRSLAWLWPIFEPIIRTAGTAFVDYKGELTEKEKAPWANRGELPTDLRFFDNVYTVQCNPKLSPLEDTSVPPNATQALLDQTKSVLDWNQNLLDSTQELLTSSHSLLDRSQYLLDATQSLLDAESDPTSDVSTGSDVQGDAVVVNKGSESTDAMVVSPKAPSVDSATNGDESTTDSKVPVSSTDVTDAGVEIFLNNSPVPSGCRSTQTPPSSVEAALKGLRGLIQITEEEDGIISELDSSSSFRAWLEEKSPRRPFLSRDSALEGSSLGPPFEFVLPTTAAPCTPEGSTNDRLPLSPYNHQGSPASKLWKGKGRAF